MHDSCSSTWYTLADSIWYTLADSIWYIITRLMTQLEGGKRSGATVVLVRLARVLHVDLDALT